MSRLRVFRIQCLCLAWGAVVQGEQKDIYLEYVADAECPSRSEFVAQVRARTSLAQFVDAASADRRFTLSARIKGGSAVGRFTVGHGAQSGTTRQVTSERCEDVVTALALIAALAIDPNANLQKSSRPSEAGASSTGKASDASASSSASPPVMHSTARSAASPIAPQSSGATTVSGTGESRSSWQLGLLAQGALWPSSHLLPLGGLSLTAEWQSIAEQGLLPAARLSVGQSMSGTAYSDRGGGARFSLSRAALDVCALRLNIASSITVRPCIGIEGGWVTATGVRQDPIVETQTRTRPWFAIREMLRLQMDLGMGWLFALETGLAQPRWRDSFVFNYPALSANSAPYQGEIIHVPALAGELGVGVVRRFQ